MQRSGKRKRGSPEPAPRSAGSTATFSWRTLHPPRGTPRARGRGRGRTSSGRRPVIPKAQARPSNLDLCTEEETDEEQEAEAVEEEVTGEAAPTTTLPDDEEITNREEHYQQLRRAMGVSNTTDGEDPALGFSSHSLDKIQNHWDPLPAGELLARLGHFLRTVSQMMEEVGYMAELMARGHRPTPEEEGDEANLMQGTKRPRPPSHRRRALEEDTGEEVSDGEVPTSSTNIPGNLEARNTREDPIPKRRTLRQKIGLLWMPWNAARPESSQSVYDNEKSSLQLCAWSPKSQWRGMRKGPRYMAWKNSVIGGEDGDKMNQRLSYSFSTSETTCCAMSWELQQQWRYGNPVQRPARGRLPPLWTPT